MEVLAALPEMTSQLVRLIVDERATEPFAGVEDLLARVPGLSGSAAIDFLTFRSLSPTSIVSRATINSSGASRTVRLVSSRRERLLLVSTNPLFFRRVEEFGRGRWKFE
jgi:hypothetical protein